MDHNFIYDKQAFQTGADVAMNNVQSICEKFKHIPRKEQLHKLRSFLRGYQQAFRTAISMEATLLRVTKE